MDQRTICQELVALYSLRGELKSPEEREIIETAIVAFEEEAVQLELAKAKVVLVMLIALACFVIGSHFLYSSVGCVALSFACFGQMIFAAYYFLDRHFKRDLGETIYLECPKTGRCAQPYGCTGHAEPSPEFLALQTYKEQVGLGGVGTRWAFSPEPLRRLLK